MRPEIGEDYAVLVTQLEVDGLLALHGPNPGLPDMRRDLLRQIMAIPVRPARIGGRLFSLW
jgi:hypothetical protein